MGREKNENIGFLKKYKDEIRAAATIVIFLISLIGSIQYYRFYSDAQFPSLFRYLVAIFQSTLRLFLANAHVSIGTPTPFLYELARFLAPLLTSYCIYKAIQENILQYAGRLRYRVIHDHQIIVFGRNSESMQLLDFLSQENQDTHYRTILLVTDKPMSGIERLELEKKDIHIRIMDYFIEESDKAHVMRQNLLSKLYLEDTDEIVFFEKDESVNFALFGELLELQQNSSHPIRCAANITSESLANTMTEMYNNYTAQGKSAISLILFDLAELEALDLIRRHPFHEQIIQTLNKEKISSLSEIPAPHIVIAGCGTCGMAVLGMVMKTGVLNLKSDASANRRTRVTVIDKNREIRNVILKKYPRIDLVLDLGFIYGDVSDSNIMLGFENLPRITYAAVCYSSQKTNYLFMDLLHRYIEYRSDRYADGLRVPIGLRMEENSTFLHYIDQMRESDTDTVFAFGTRAAISTPASILRNDVEQMAMEFNFEYEKMAARLHGYTFDETKTKEDLWHSLSYIRKCSNRAVVMNLPYYREAIRLLGENMHVAGKLKNGEVNVGSLLKAIGGTSCEQLVQLEHLRWCDFYYCAGYVGACTHRKDKDSFQIHTEVWDGKSESWFGRVHNCLVPFDVLKSASDAETIYYDLVNIILCHEQGDQFTARIRRQDS